MSSISRKAYAEMYGPTTGDRVRLGDTELFIEVESDFTTYGEEVTDTDQQLDEVLIPGEVLINMSDEIEINLDRNRIRISVANHGDRPIQVGSHYHFYETNSALYFDREKTKGFRLNIPSGTAVRFEPGQERKVELVEYDGKKVVYGFNAKVMGKL